MCMEQGVSDSFACTWDPFLPTGLPHPAVMRICAQSYCILLYSVDILTTF